MNQRLSFILIETRSCQTPQLIGRLSGSVLSKVEWESEVSEDGTGIYLIGRYHVPEPGRYFLEIIVTMCNRLEYDANFAQQCLQDPDHHRLTHTEAAINVIPAHMQNQTDVLGYWYKKNQTDAKAEPLLTRYQP